MAVRFYPLETRPSKNKNLLGPSSRISMLVCVADLGLPRRSSQGTSEDGPLEQRAPRNPLQPTMMHLHLTSFYRKGGYVWKHSSSSNFSSRAFRPQICQFEFFEFILLLKLDKQFPVDNLLATASQSTVPSPLLFYDHSESVASKRGWRKRGRRGSAIDPTHFATSLKHGVA